MIRVRYQSPGGSRVKKCIRLTSSLFIAALVPLSTMSQRTVRPSWPKKMGVYISAASGATPLFPRELSGYR